MATTPDGGAPLAPATAALLAAYRAELLRWNRQVNLLSRRDPEGTADALVRQCAAAFTRWWEASGAGLVGPASALRLVDLGSGGGLPAFVWLALLAERGVAVRATLVEPRRKRAWFLERLRQLPGAPPYEVAAAVWGPQAGGLAAGAAGDGAFGSWPILFTIKALRLSEGEVLGPLPAALGDAALSAGSRVEIVRFQPAEGVTAAGLARELAIPAVGTTLRWGGGAFQAEDCRYLAPAPGEAADGGGAGLLVSRHLVVP